VPRVGRSRSKELSGMALHCGLLIVLAPAAHRAALGARMQVSPEPGEIVLTTGLAPAIDEMLVRTRAGRGGHAIRQRKTRRFPRQIPDRRQGARGLAAGCSRHHRYGVPGGTATSRADAGRGSVWWRFPQHRRPYLKMHLQTSRLRPILNTVKAFCGVQSVSERISRPINSCTASRTGLPSCITR
jgi:hypothetical protein